MYENSRISFHNGSIREETVVRNVVRRGESVVVIADLTPFHPRDYQWPDQPSDKGSAVNSSGERFAVTDAIFTAADVKGDYYFDMDIPVKKGETGWTFAVAHTLGTDADFAAGDRITLEVDAAYRKGLSRVHSATHVMALALNKAFAPLWRKDAPSFDALGSPGFDGLAIQRSKIGSQFCVDSYRLGKSLRKKGFTATELVNDLKNYENEVNSRLAEWLAQDALVTIYAADCALSTRRFWRTKIDGLDVEIPCGGTHVASLSEIGTPRVTMEMTDGETLTVVTSLSY